MSMSAAPAAPTVPAASYTHWRLRHDTDGLAWLDLDQAGSSTNTLSAAVMHEFGTVLDALDARPPRGLVIASAKAAGFIAGADIDEFTRLDSPAAARALVQRGWDLFERLAAVRYPTLALIRGHCLGGGLELALACRYRIVVDEPGTRLALPEVMLGIVPGWGGIKRLPACIGPALALDLMLTGKGVDAPKAKRIGLADDCVPPRVMENAARMRVLGAGAPTARPWMARLVNEVRNGLMNGPLRARVADKARTQVAARARREHYPAPYAIIDLWADFGGSALAVPASHPSSLENLFASPTTQQLVRVYQLQERLKGFGKGSDFVACHVHVVGAGVMGGDIAALCALRGLTVTVQDQSIDRIAPAIARAAKLFERRFKGDPRPVRFALDRLIPDPQGHGVARADVIIEAIVENLDAKRTLFAALERRARPDAVLATNTSSLRLEDIAPCLADPARLVGIHFFNPVAMMPLVEVVHGEATAASVQQRAAAFVRQLDKLPLPVRSAPGFLVNAVLGPYMLEALRCVEKGVAPETVDAALVAFGMPLGPVELVDSVGLDIAVAAGNALAGADAVPPPRLLALVAAGKLGRKSGEGYYRWVEGKAKRATPGAVPAGLAERILAPLLAATRRCVDQGVVADADLADAGVIFGSGFAPWTGGPMHYQQHAVDATVAAPAGADHVPATTP